jgi:glutaredoxin
VGVKIHILEVNEHPDGSQIHNYIQKKTGKSTVPVVFIRGNFIGGCDDVKTLHVKGDLEHVLLKGLINRPRTIGTDKLETSQLLPVERSRATHPLFWFPNTVNNLVIRVVGFQVFTASVISCIFLNEMWARYLAAAVLVDFCLRFVAGSAASPFGMVATLVTSPFRPQFRPGPPKQFASACGIMFSGLGTLFYFVEFRGHQYVGCAFMAGLAGASGLEWTIDFCLGCKFFAIGIYMNLIPDHVYRIYTSTRQEVEDRYV